MFKLMKYEFRKLRNALLIMLGTLAALEIGFIAGNMTKKSGMMETCLILIVILTFVVFAYIILAGMASYSRELKEKSGYLIFMTPVRPIGVVLSKLLFTAIAALVAGALFGAAVYFDIRYLVNRMNLDKETIEQINLILRFGLNANADLFQIARRVGFVALTVLIYMMVTMCTAYLAITVSATLLQNKRGFLRALVSLGVFIALTRVSGWLSQRLVYDSVRDADITMRLFLRTLGWSMLLNGSLGAIYAGVSAWLLGHKVNL